MENQKANLLFPKESYDIRGACFAIYKIFRNHHKEAVYHNSLIGELQAKGLTVEKEKRIPVKYNGKIVGTYIPDIIVNDQIVIKLKAKPYLIKDNQKQFWSYLKGAPYQLGFLVNFGAQGGVQIERYIYTSPQKFRIGSEKVPHRFSANRGFTAIEMLIAVAIIVLLLGIAAISLRDQGPKNRNAERRNEVNAISQALTQWSLDSGIYIPTGIPESSTNKKCVGTNTPTCYDLLFLMPQYLNSIPEDPKNTNGQSDTGYTIYKDAATKEIIIGAPMAENGETIQAVRK